MIVCVLDLGATGVRRVVLPGIDPADIAEVVAVVLREEGHEERTYHQVRIVADPDATGTPHKVEVPAHFGAMTVELNNLPLPAHHGPADLRRSAR